MTPLIITGKLLSSSIAEWIFFVICPSTSSTVSVWSKPRETSAGCEKEFKEYEEYKVAIGQLLA